MKTVIYVRVSSTEQAQEGFSIPSQMKLLTEYASKNDYKIEKEFVAAESAKNSGRENFNKMIEYLKQNPQVKTIICEKTDRLSRNFRDIATLDDLIKYESSLNIVLVKENTIINNNSGSNEKFIFGIKALMSKNYIDNLSEETRKGLNEKASQGHYPGCAPIGYKNTTKLVGNKEIRCLKLDLERSPFIEKLFKYYATGNYSTLSLTKQLYAEGFRNKKGGNVGKATIHSILRSPFYYGRFRWAKKLHEGSHPRIISKGLFDAVQNVLNGYDKPQFSSRQFAYSGLMKCKNCGCNITAEIHKGKFIYYHCTGSKGNCKPKYVREEALDKQFSEIIQKIQIDDELLELIKQTLLDSHKDELEFHTKKVITLKARKTKLESHIHHTYIDKIETKIDQSTYESVTKRLRDELISIKESIARYETADDSYLTQGVKILELCNKAHHLYLQQEPLERAKLLKYVFSNCHLDGVSVCPTYRKPFNLFAEGLPRLKWGG